METLDSLDNLEKEDRRLKHGLLVTIAQAGLLPLIIVFLLNRESQEILAQLEIKENQGHR